MSLPASNLILDLLTRTVKSPQLIVEIDGLPTFSSLQNKKYAKYGDPGAIYGIPGFVYGGLINDELSFPYIDLGKSTNNITQQLLIDKGGYSSSTNFDISLVDIDGYITKVITPGYVIEDILARKARIYLSLEGAGHPEDSILFFSGIVSDVKSGSGYVNINISSPERLKNLEIFPKVSTELAIAVNSSATTFTVVDTAQFILPADSGTLRSYFKIGDEIVEYTGATATTFTGCVRGRFGTIATAHAVEASLETFYRLQGNLRDLSLKLMLSGGPEYHTSDIEVLSFNSYGLSSNPNAVYLPTFYPDQIYGIVIGDTVNITGSLNPGNNGTAQILSIATNDVGSFLILNKTLISEGAGALIAFKTKYNVLPKFAGLEMTPDQVDVSEFEKVYTQFQSQFFQYDFYIKDQINGSDFINTQILYPSGCYALPRKAKTSIGLTIPPLAQSGTKKLSNLNVTKASNIKINRSISKNFYNSIIYRYDKDAVEDKYTRGKITQSANSTNRINISNKPLQIDSDGIRASSNFDYLFQTQTRRFLDRYQFGAESLDVQVLFGDAFTIEIGDTVILDGQLLQISDTKAANGTRTFLPRLFEVQNKSMSLKGTDITLTLVDTVYSLDGRYGVIAPSSTIGTGSTTNKISLNKSYGDVLTDRLPTIKWLNYIGEKVLVRNDDWSFQEIVRITAVDPSNPYNLIVSPALSIAPTEGMILDTPRYPNSTDAADQAIYKAAHCSWNMTRQVLATSTDTTLIFNSLDAPAFVVGAPVIVHSKDWTVKSIEVKIKEVFLSSVSPSYVTLSKPLGFTPTTDMIIEFLGYPDGGSPYRFL
jgi:hypothetical protein